jgi:hypothetical protein
MIRMTLPCLLLAGLPAVADTPPVAFYVGLYRVIGVDTAGPVDRALRVDAVDGLPVVTLCGGAATMVLPAPTDEPYVTLVMDGKSLTCEGFSTYDYLPILACYGEDDRQARLTLWPADNFAAGLDCAE